MSKRELRAAEAGFLRLLRCKRFSTVWIEENAADLFAQAQKEYAERLAEGKPADNPVGWLIVCAWQRTKNLLDSRRRRPRESSIEVAVDLVDAATPTPEQEVIDRDRIERIRKAMGYLTDEERRLLELSYFDGMSVREAGRELGWSKSSADRHHQAALERLRAMLGDQRDLLAAELGLAAWLARARAHGFRVDVAHGPAVIAEVAKDAVDGAAAAFAHAWRRLGAFTDPGAPAALSGPARAAGACAAAVACIATGIVGPGVGGVISHSAPTAKPSGASEAAKVAPAPPQTSSAAAPTSTTPGSTEAHAPTSGREASRVASKRDRLASKPVAPHHEDHGAAERTVTEFGVDGGSSGSSASSPASTAPPTSAARVSGSTAAGSSSGSSAGSTSHGSGSSSGSEFGM